MPKITTVEKVVSFKVMEFENFYFVNDRIMLKSQLDKIEVKLTGLGYDGMLGIKLPHYNIIKREVATDIADWEAGLYGRGPEIKRNGKKHWTERCYYPDKPFTIEQLEAADADPKNSLFWFCGYDHSLWDIDMNRVSVPFHLDYIQARLSNDAYKLKSLREHLLKVPDSVISRRYVSEIHNIPHYNASEERDRCFFAELLLSQTAYDTVMSGTRRDKVDREYKELAKVGYYQISSDDQLAGLKELLGFKQFEKPPKPEHDDD